MDSIGRDLAGIGGHGQHRKRLGGDRRPSGARARAISLAAATSQEAAPVLPTEAPAPSGTPESGGVDASLRKKRERRGLCPTCGIKLYSVQSLTRRRTPVRRADGVVAGTCLKCSPGIARDGYATPSGRDVAAALGAAAGVGGRARGTAGGGGANPPVGTGGRGVDTGGTAAGPAGRILPPAEIETTAARGVTPRNDSFTIVSGLTMDQTLMATAPNPATYGGGGVAGAAPRLTPAPNENEESHDDGDAAQAQSAGRPVRPDCILPNSSRVLMGNPSALDPDALEGFDLDDGSARSGASPARRRRPSEPQPRGPGDPSGNARGSDDVDRARGMAFAETVALVAAASAADFDPALGRAKDCNSLSGGGGENGASVLAEESGGDERSNLAAASTEQFRSDDGSSFHGGGGGENCAGGFCRGGERRRRATVSTEQFRSDCNSSFPSIAAMHASQDLAGFDLSVFDSFSEGGDGTPEDRRRGDASRPPSAERGPRTDSPAADTMPPRGPADLSRHSRASNEVDVEARRTTFAEMEALETAEPPPRGPGDLSRHVRGSNEVDDKGSMTFAETAALEAMTFTETEALEAAAAAADFASAVLDPTGYLAEASRGESLRSQDMDAQQWRRQQFEARADNAMGTAEPTEAHCVGTDAAGGSVRLKLVNGELLERLPWPAADGGPVDSPQSHMDAGAHPLSAAEGPEVRAVSANEDDAAKLSSRSPDAAGPPPRGPDRSGNAHGSMAFTEAEAMEAAATAADFAAAALDHRREESADIHYHPASATAPTETRPVGQETAYHRAGTDTAVVGSAQSKSGDPLEDDAAADGELRGRPPSTDSPRSRLPDEGPPPPSSAAVGPRVGAAAANEDGDAARSSSRSPDERGGGGDSERRPSDVRRFRSDSALPPRHPARKNSRCHASSARSLNIEEEKVEVDEERVPASFRSSSESPKCMIGPEEEDDDPSLARSRVSGA